MKSRTVRDAATKTRSELRKAVATLRKAEKAKLFADIHLREATASEEKARHRARVAACLRHGHWVVQ